MKGYILAFIFTILIIFGAREIKAGIKYVPIITDTYLLNLREEPSKNSKVLMVLSNNEKLEYIETLKTGWTKVRTFDGVEGFVQSFFITLKEESWFNTVSLASELIEYGKQFIGTTYVWGGNSLTKGIDCSGFTKQVFAYKGIGLPRTAALQSKIGTRVERGDLQEGDLIFFSDIKSESLVTHVGIYIGSSTFIHSGSAKGVEINTLNREWYSSHFVLGRRIIR